MNKKFSTLLAGVLLATSMGANGAVIPMTITPSSVTSTALTGVTAGGAAGGYRIGISYLLGASATQYLAVDNDGDLELTNVLPSSLTGANQALWTLQNIITEVGAVAPKYVFVNKATGVLLAMDKSKATPFGGNGAAVTDPNAVNSEVGGEQMEWLSAASFTEPQIPAAGNAIYASIPGDSVVALATVNGTDHVYLAKMKTSELAQSNVVKVKPYVYDANSNIVLSAYDLNTMLRNVAGDEATAESYFKLNFNPAATMLGNPNLFTQDLQAVAVDQYEIDYGTENTVVADAYASFYPLTTNTGSDFKARRSAADVSYENTGSRWLALKNRDGKYLVADTAFVNGTQQDANKRITFTFDGLYNAKNNTRFRNPNSYLYAFYYNPSTGTIRIQVKEFYNNPTTVANRNTTAFNEATFYGADYANPAAREGSRWYSTSSQATSTNPLTDATYVIKAALGSTTEVTLGTLTASDGSSNEFAIRMGASDLYRPTYIPSNAYLIKVTGSSDPDRVGKYLINNLKGGIEVMEQAVRQNFQDMPAAQWIVKSAGTTAGSLVTINNREFAGTLPIGGIPYGVKGASDQAFFMSGRSHDTLQFIPVAKPSDKYLGYKYVANDTIDESIFTFNYLHDLAMNKPINTQNDVDSVVWVDKDGNAVKFVLEAVIDDAYGTNGGLTNVSDLVRRVYRIKVNDATKLQNDKRYLCYDATQKKYLVSERPAEDADVFFLKENNEVENGDCYYALVKANIDYVVAVTGNGQAAATAYVDTHNGGLMVLDGATDGLFIAEKGKYFNPSTGMKDKEGLVVKVFTGVNAYQDAQEYMWNINRNIYGSVEEYPYQGAIAASVPSAGYAIQLYSNNDDYASYKVSVDNNTLDLVNGVLNNDAAREVVTSAFAVERDADPLYRRFNVAAIGENADDTPNVLKFYRINSTVNEYLYEDGQSKYSTGKEFNFLGIEGKGDNKKAAMYVDTAYVNRETKMPQYLLVLDPQVHIGDTVWCGENHTNLADSLSCIHTKVTPTYVEGRYLVNLQDSIDLNQGAQKAKYQWNSQYTRLGFVEARHIGDTLVIKNSRYTGNNEPIEIGKAATWAGKDSIFLGDNKHKNVVFSFRLMKSGSNDFLIESETEKDGNYCKNVDLTGAKLAPMKGGWVKIQNGVPVIANVTYNEAGREAEIFNVETTDEVPTANETIAAGDGVTVQTVPGAVIVKNAAGKSVKVSNILGQPLAETVLSSDYATIPLPAGIVVVAVEDAAAVKTIVK